MTFTVSLAELSLFIIAIAILILVVSLVPALIQLRRTARALQELSEDGKRVLADVKEITLMVKNQVSDMGDAAHKVREVVLKATGIAGVLVDGIGGAALKIVGLIAGLTFGLKQFGKGGK
jgi:hypothetical protein